MKDDFDNGMGLPDEEIGGSLGDINELGTGIEAEPELGGEGAGSRSSGGARARLAPGPSTPASAPKAAAAKPKAAAKKKKASGKKKAARKSARKPARKSAKARKARKAPSRARKAGKKAARRKK
jgi:hypothetical protein